NKILTGNYNGDLLTELEFASLPFPTRVYVDNAGNFAYIPSMLTVKKILLETGDIVSTIDPFKSIEMPEDAFITSVYSMDELIFLTVHGTDFDKLYIYNANTNEIMFDTNTDPYPIQTLVAGKYLFILCEGIMGQNNSKLWVYEIDNTQGLYLNFTKEFDVGDAGNHIFNHQNNKLLITANGSHEIHILDIPNLTIEDTIKTPTTGFDGPRESNVIGNDAIVVSAYDGNLYTFDFNGVQLSKISLNSKLEGIFTYTLNPVLNYYIVAVTSPFQPNYSPNDKVFLFVNFSTVEESTSPIKANLYPNPSQDYISLKFEENLTNTFNLNIVNIFGQTLKKYQFTYAGNEIKIPVNDLSIGTYTALISYDGNNFALPFSIIR
ncbi:MAG: T9SS type A sorting domain-containing protein, partial [Candidatus Kapaibacteriota bacterium]